MISRRATKAIADAYHRCFTYMSSYPRSGGSSFRFYRERLYDFLFVYEMRVWLLNGVKQLSVADPRGLVEYIMRLHTGESLVAATSGWPWKARVRLGQEVLRELAEALLVERASRTPFQEHGLYQPEAVDQMRSALELDGYLFQGGQLRIPEESPVSEPEEEGVLESIAAELALDDRQTLSHHLKLAAEHYAAQRWDDSISNSRKVLEWVLTAAAGRYAAKNQAAPRYDPGRPASVREFLESTGLLEKREKEAIAQAYGLLSATGGHPYMAGRDQARLMRHLALTFSQFALLRLKGALAGVSDCKDS